MNFQTLQTHVFRLMRDPNQTKYSLDFVKKWLNDAERLYCNETSYSVKKDTTISTSSGTREYDLPSDFLSEIEIFYDGSRLNQCEIEDTVHADGDHSGTPFAYYIENKKIGLEYKPTATKTLTLIYNSMGGAMEANADLPIIPDEHHRLLIAYACIQCSIEGDDTRQSTFEKVWDKGIEKAKEDVINKSPWPDPTDPAPYRNPALYDTEGIL